MKTHLARLRQIKLNVIGRNSGKTISIPVWFVVEDDTLYLLPVNGSNTQWYKNVLKHPAVRIDARGEQTELKVLPITAPADVTDVINKFREKYGAGDVKKYYSRSDVAVRANLA